MHQDEIAPETLQQHLTTGDVIVVDVREPFEMDHGMITGAVALPLGEILAGAAVPGCHDDDPRPVVLYCHAGVRSMHALQHLKIQFPDKEMKSLAGGYAAWEAIA